MENDLSKEVKLARSLKDQCDQKGKEININTTTKILHQFGKLYREKSPDKISLIRSAVFFNAALVRQPWNEDVKRDLQELCLHILQVAGAEKLKTAAFSEISENVEEKVRRMRDYTNSSLEKLEIISSGLPEDVLHELKNNKVEKMKEIQTAVADRYTELMDYISRECAIIMGQPPCKYSVTGMGSLARKEITPYSDFEHIILLEEGVQHREDYEDIVEYFRWFSVIFHVIVINLKETIVRAVAVPLLNDSLAAGGDWFFDAFTTCGIKFDGMQIHACKFPLGRTQLTEKKPWVVELIKPVSIMAKYLESEEELKHGYHLADILTKTCFVSGFQEIHKCFEEQVRVILSRNQKSFSTPQFLLKELKDELDERFVTLTNVVSANDNPRFNMKQAIYRSSTLYIAALGRIFLRNINSCFDIVDALHEEGLLTNNCAEELMFAIAVACETRLRVYMSKKGQDDFIGGSEVESIAKSLGELGEVIGEYSLSQYFKIVHGLRVSFRFCKHSYWMDCHCGELDQEFLLDYLNNYHSLNGPMEDFFRSNALTQTDVDVLQSQFNIVRTLLDLKDPFKATSVLKILEKRYKNDTVLYAAICMFKVNCFCHTKKFSDGILSLRHCRDEVNRSNLDHATTVFITATLHGAEGYCNMGLKRYSTAERCFKISHSYCSRSNNYLSTVSAFGTEMGILLCQKFRGRPVCGQSSELSSKTHPPNDADQNPVKKFMNVLLANNFHLAKSSLTGGLPALMMQHLEYAVIHTDILNELLSLVSRIFASASSTAEEKPTEGVERFFSLISSSQVGVSSELGFLVQRNLAVNNFSGDGKGNPSNFSSMAQNPQTASILTDVSGLLLNTINQTASAVNGEQSVTNNLRGLLNLPNMLLPTLGFSQISSLLEQISEDEESIDKE